MMSWEKTQNKTKQIIPDTKNKNRKKPPKPKKTLCTYQAKSGKYKFDVLFYMRNRERGLLIVKITRYLANKL